MDEAVTDEALLQTALQRHPDALAFMGLWQAICHFFDDVADADAPLSARDAERAIWAALVELPRNRFYSAHFAELNPLVANAISNWALANELEESGEAGPCSFVIRSAYLDVMTHALTLCLGREAAQPLARALRKSCHSEGLDGYLKNLALQFETARR